MSGNSVLAISQAKFKPAIVQLGAVIPGPFQKRRLFKRAEMEKLVDSLIIEGIINQPVVIDRGDGKYPLLSGERRDSPERQQTLRDAIDWSVRLLSPSEQTLFRRLGVFVGGFTHVVHLHAQHRLNELLGEDPPLAPPDDDISLPASPSESPGQSALDQIAAFARWGEYRKRQRSG